MTVLTPEDDVFVGGDLAETITALAGNDSLVMGGGNDTVFGSGGMDTIFGGDGDDSLLYAQGFDQERGEPIAGTDGARAPFFSPDGAWIGFLGGDGRPDVPGATPK